MLNDSKLRRTLATALVASAVAVSVFGQPAKADPAPGTCKFRFEHAVAPTAQTAQQAWIGLVAGKFGSKWAQWAGAKNKTVVPMAGGYYQAVAKPCFYQPVT
jgi:hypothetical protein